MSRTFISSAQSENTFGEARYTEPTGVDQNRELYVDYLDTDERDREEWLKGIGTSDWIRCIRGNNVLLFKPEAFIDTNSAGRAFLFTASNAHITGSWPSDASLTGDFTFETTALDLGIYAKTDLSNLDDISNAGQTKIAAFFAKLDLSNITTITSSAATKIRDGLIGVINTQFKAAVQSPSDPYTFQSAYTRKAGVTAKGQLTFASTPVLNGQQVQLTIGFQDNDEAAAVSRWITHNEFVWNGGRYRLENSATEFQQTNNQYQAAVVLIDGTVGAVDSSAIPVIEPDNPHRQELVSTAFKDSIVSPAYKYARTTGSGDTVYENPISNLSTIQSSEKKHPTAGAVKSYVDGSHPAVPQYGQVQEIRTYALGTDWTIVPSNNSAATGQAIAITPNSASSKFRIYTNIHLGSLNNQTRVEVRIARKIGTGSWTSVVDKDYVLYTGSTYNGAMDLSFGPYVDAPNTTDEVSYRIQLRRHGTPAANIETAFVEVNEVL